MPASSPCQMLPGPASSQTGFLVGLRRAGWAGALGAWAGFTLPSALAGFLLLERWSAPPLTVVAFCVAAALVSVLAA